jgi:hypothetical protein
MSFAANVDSWFLVLFHGFCIALVIGAPLLRKRRHGPWQVVSLTAIGVVFVDLAGEPRA